MALTLTPTVVINSTATATSYTGAFAPAVAGNPLLVIVAGYKGTNTDTPGTGLAVTLGGATATLGLDENATNVGDWIGIYTIPAAPAGSNTLTVSGVSFRSMSVIVYEADGADTAAPFVAFGSQRSSLNLSALSFNRTTTANGNALISGLIVRAQSGMVPATIAGEISATGGATLFPSPALATGSNVTNDHIFAAASQIVPTAGASGHGYAWTTATRADLVWAEIKAGSGATSWVATPADLTVTGETASWSMGPTDYVATPADLTVTGEASSWSMGAIGPLTIIEAPADGFVFDSADRASATFVIRGTGTTGDSIQVRGESAGGNTAWSAGATVDGAGNWSASVVVPRALWGTWYQPVARIGTNDATKVSAVRKIGGGFDVMILGQSELEYTLNTSAFYSGVTRPTLRAENLTVITLSGIGGAPVWTRVTAANLASVNVAMIALANALDMAAPGVKFAVFDAAVVGTSRAGLMADGDDAGGGRTWADVANMVATVRAGGSEIGTVLECWYNSDAATLKTFGPEWSPLYMGQRWGGGVFTLGTANPDSTRNPGTLVDHCLWDVEAAAGVTGRGLFARARTKYLMLAPLPFFDTSTGTEEVNYSDTTNGGARIGQLDRPARDTLEAFTLDSRVATFALGYGPSMHIVDFGGGIHPLTDSEWGVAQFGRNYLPGFLKVAGVAVGEPRITGAEAPPGGAYVDLIVDLPNGGNLTTIRTLNALAAPATEPPHYQQVNGIEVRRVGDTDSQRRPVYKSSETTYPAAYRGSVTIVDAGSGSPPTRTGRIRVTPDTPFVTGGAGDRLEFMRGQGSGHLLAPRDVNARLFMDMAVEHVPGWYDGARLYPFQGVAVKPQPALLTITQVAITDWVATPADLTVQGASASWSLGPVTYVATPADLTVSGEAASWSLGGLVWVASPADLTVSGEVASWSMGPVTYVATPADLTVTGEAARWSIGALLSQRWAYPGDPPSSGRLSRG